MDSLLRWNSCTIFTCELKTSQTDSKHFVSSDEFCWVYYYQRVKIRLPNTVDILWNPDECVPITIAYFFLRYYNAPLPHTSKQHISRRDAIIQPYTTAYCSQRHYNTPSALPYFDNSVAVPDMLKKAVFWLW